MAIKNLFLKLIEKQKKTMRDICFQTIKLTLQLQLQASNMRKNFIIFGTGKHALLVLNEITMEYITDQIFFFNDKEKKNLLKIGNKKYPIFKSFSKLNKKMKKNSYFFIAVGSNSLRKKIYDETKKKIIGEPIELAQEFRSFTYEMPW